MKNKYLEIDFKDLVFWGESPRIPESLKFQDEDFSKVLPYFMFNMDLESLMGSLIALGWFPTEPLNVIERYDGTYVIRDGNRRYLACWLLLNSEKSMPNHFKEIADGMTPEQKDRLNKVFVITI